MGLVHFAALGLLGLTLELSAGFLLPFEVLQSPKSMAVTAGESATFSCTITGPDRRVTGGVRWYKESGESRTLIYSSIANEGVFPRVSQVSPWPNIDMSIMIHNLSSTDTGTYYCVTFYRHPLKKEQFSGTGTCLFVSGERAQMITVLQSPTSINVKPGDLATFSCTVSLAPCNVLAGPVRWYKVSGEYRTLIYSDDLSPLPHVSRVSPTSSTDWSIRLTNVSTQDTGTYYCVKFTSGASQDEEHASSTGTSMSVGVGASDNSGVYISSQTFWIGFVVEKLCLMALILGVFYLKQRN